MEEFSILERKVKDLLNRYESILAEHRALTENISFLNKVKLELETKINSFKEEKTILEADKRNIADNLNILDYCKIQDAIFLKILSFHSI